MLTRIQALLLDGHFAVEHQARSHLGFCFNFNGTAGVWRRQAIDDAGGWSFSTITEDLELSLRAQQVGYRFRYLHNLVVPAELPERWSALRTQQARWVRGSMETARLHAFALLFETRFGWLKRADAFFSVTNNLSYFLMLVLGVLLPLTVGLRDQLLWRVPFGQNTLAALDLLMLGLGTCAMAVFYGVGAVSVGRREFRPLVEIPMALAVGLGLSVSNSAAAFAGLFGSESHFVRTPKRGDASEVALVRLYSRSIRFVHWVELTFAIYFGLSIVYAVSRELWGAILFLALYFVGFSVVAFSTIRERLRDRRILRPQYSRPMPTAG